MELQWAAIQQVGAAKELKKLKREDILVVVGVIPPQDFEALVQAGTAAIYPPGTVITEAAVDLL
jgi:methylmalonyl-CoA mutase